MSLSVSQWQSTQLLFVFLFLAALLQQMPGLPPIPVLTRKEHERPSPQYLFNLLHVVLIMLAVAYCTSLKGDTTMFHTTADSNKVSVRVATIFVLGLYPVLNGLQYAKHQNPHFLYITALGAIYALLGYGIAKHCSQADVTSESVKTLHTPLKKAFAMFQFQSTNSKSSIYLWLTLWLIAIGVSMYAKIRPLSQEEQWTRRIEAVLVLATLIAVMMSAPDHHAVHLLLRCSVWALLGLLLYALANNISSWFYLDAVLALLAFTAMRHTTIGTSDDAKALLGNIVCL
jgi:hypothetical protein